MGSQTVPFQGIKQIPNLAIIWTQLNCHYSREFFFSQGFMIFKTCWSFFTVGQFPMRIKQTEMTSQSRCFLRERIHVLLNLTQSVQDNIIVSKKYTHSWTERVQNPTISKLGSPLKINSFLSAFLYKCSKFLSEQISADFILFHLKYSMLVVGMLTGTSLANENATLFCLLQSFKNVTKGCH